MDHWVDHGDAPHLSKNVLGSIPTQLLDLLTGKGADRNTHVLQALPRFSGYNNLFQYRSVSAGMAIAAATADTRAILSWPWAPRFC